MTDRSTEKPQFVQVTVRPGAVDSTNMAGR